MITLPQATYITIDPCYVMRDDAYDILCDKMDFNTRAQIVEIDHRFKINCLLLDRTSV